MNKFWNYLTGYDETASNANTNTGSSLPINEKLLTFKKFLKHLKLIFKLLFPRLFCVSTLLLLLLLIDVVALEFVVYQVGLLGGKFYKSLSDKNLSTFRDWAFISLGFIVLDALMVSIRDFLAQLLSIVWRKYVTLKIHELYFSNKNFYYLQQTHSENFNNNNNNNSNIDQLSPNNRAHSVANRFRMNSKVGSINININGNNVLIDPTNNENIPQTAAQNNYLNSSKQFPLDNPDQRITQDVNSLCQSFSTIMPLILVSPFVIAWYTYQTFINVGYAGPLTVFLYFIFWGIVNGPFTSPIAKVIYAQDRKEGDFRFKHMNLRANVESIAFYDSSLNELWNMNKTFEALLNVSYRRNWREFFLKFFVNTSQYLGGIIAYLVLGIPIFTNVYDNLTPAELAQLISNFSFKCQYLIYLFTRLYNTLDEISTIAGNSHRVGELIDKMNRISEHEAFFQVNQTQNKINNPDELLRNEQEPENTNDSSYTSNPTDNEICFITKNLNVIVPDSGKVLIRNLNFKFEKNVNVLVTGRSGCGKTSLLRCLNGLWHSYTGEIILNQKETSFLFFLPQNPYFTSGSLLEQIIYPSLESDVIKDNIQLNYLFETIKVWLRLFNLEHLLQKVNSNLILKPDFNWISILSGGEQQRLSFLRVLYHRPKFVLLDEFTSSVDQQTEELMYQNLIGIQTTYLSIAHRDTVRKYHSIELKILGDSNVQVVNLNENILKI